MNTLDTTLASAKPLPRIKEPHLSVLFNSSRIGSFRLRFEDEDEQPIKPKKSDGYLALKLRGGGLQSRHFVLESDGALPPRKQLLGLIEEFYSRSSHYKVAQVHIEARIK